MALSAQELQKLSEKTKLVEDKFYNDWIMGKDASNLEKNRDAATKVLQKGKENMEQLDRKIEEYKSMSEAKQNEIDKFSEEVSSLHKEMEKLQLEVKNLKEKKTEVIRHKAETENILAKEKEDQEQKKLVNETKRLQNKQSVEMFQERLGLQIKKINGEHLQFVFKLIDPQDWERPFFFVICLDANNTYQVIDCDPAVDDISQLTEQLNKTNDLSSFVVEMRKRFKRTVSK